MIITALLGFFAVLFLILASIAYLMWKDCKDRPEKCENCVKK